MNQQIPASEVLTRSKLEKVLGINRSTASQLLQSGAFPHAFRLDGGAWRVPVSDVEAYKAARRVSKPATEPAPSVVNSDGQGVQQRDEKADPHHDGSVPREGERGAS